MVSLGEQNPVVSKLLGPSNVLDYWNAEIAPKLDLSKENLIVISLKSNHTPIGWNHASMGTVNEAFAHPRDIFRPVIVSNAVGFIVLHNHPTGDPTPSEADRRLTQRVREAANILLINFFDHIIIGNDTGKHFSFREAGII